MNLFQLVKKKELQLPIEILALMLIIIAGFLAIGREMQDLLRWDIALFIFNISMLPLLSILFKGFKNGGYLFGRVIGLAIVSYIMWMLSALHITKFSSISLMIICLLVLIVSYLIAISIYYKKNDSLEGISSLFEKYSIEAVLKYEIVFLGVFFLCTYYLAQKIPGNETERLMDYAFMLTISKSEYMPPLDVWAAGEAINYYYYGQYMISLIGKLAGVSVANSYSLGLSMIMTMGLTLSYQITHEMLLLSGRLNAWVCRVGGLLSSIGVCIAGNVHYLVFYKLMPLIADLMRVEGERESYWFADSTRYIGYTPFNEQDRTITEFPSYSFLIGDLHAHVIDLIIVLTIVAVLVAIAYKRCKILNVNLIIGAFLVGIASMTNYWDFVIYLTAGFVILLVINVVRDNVSIRDVGITFIQTGILLVVSSLTSYLFMNQFDKMVDGIGRVTIHSLVSQLIVLWGLPIASVILFIIFLSIRGYLGKNVSDNLAIALGICGIGLIIIPELVFVKDIYISGFPRSNTMFKLTYQAFILFGLSMGYMLTMVLNGKPDEEHGIRVFVRDRSICRVAVFLTFVWICTFAYPVTASRMWMGDYKTWEYKGIDSIKTICENLGEDIGTVNWINDNINDQSVILTSYGDSYTYDCVIPALTGHPTVVGWQTHEWLWHNSYDYVRDRQSDVAEIYTGSDLNYKKQLLSEYNIDYVYVGNRERERFGGINYDALYTLGTVIYQSNDGECILYKLN